MRERERERASYLHLFGLSSLELGASLCRCEGEIEVEEMGDDALDRDARIKLSIGTKNGGRLDGQFYSPIYLVFDPHRDLLFVADTGNSRVQVLSCDDDRAYDRGPYVSKFGGLYGSNPYGIAIDHDQYRILVVDSGNNQVQSWHLSYQSLLSCIGEQG